jgi:LysR family transcriptional regulator, regulator for genes of the gallate degradation pathway
MLSKFVMSAHDGDLEARADLLNIRNLRAFTAVAQSGSVIKSSRLVRRAQSAVTRSIKELEADVGVQLFERRSQGMLLTEFGRALLARVERAFEEMDAARSAFRNAPLSASLIEKAPIFSLSISRQRLLVFAELVEQRHMGAVADSLGVSQPAASQALREIEASVGAKLFIRGAGGMQPLPLGALLGTHIRRALAEIRAGEVEIQSLRGAIAGRVIVGSLSLGRTRLLPKAIIQLTKNHPNLTVTTIEGTFEHLATRLRAGDIDFMLGALRPPEHTIGLAREVVTRDVLSIVAGSSHPLARKRKLTFADLASTDWVLPPHGAPTRELLENALRNHGLSKTRVVVETADLAITRGILIGSNMLTAVSIHLFHEDIAAKALVVLPLMLPETGRPIGILQRQASSPSLAAQLLMANIRSIGQL